MESLTQSRQRLYYYIPISLSTLSEVFYSEELVLNSDEETLITPLLLSIDLRLIFGIHENENPFIITGFKATKAEGSRLMGSWD